MQRVIITPAGRKKTLEILATYLIKEYNNNVFDKWFLLDNVGCKEDEKYISMLEEKYDFVKIKTLEFTPKTTLQKILSYIDDSYVMRCIPLVFFANQEYQDDDAIYIRLDDDIVFFEKGALEKLFLLKQCNTDAMFIYGNIVNNPIINYYYHKYNIINFDTTLDLNVFQNKTYLSGSLASRVHKLLFEKIKNNHLKHFYFPNQIVPIKQRFPINVMCWLGRDYKKYHNYDINIKTMDEEKYLSIKLCEISNMKKIICGNALFSHYSYFTQYKYLSNTDILERYKGLTC